MQREKPQVLFFGEVEVDVWRGCRGGGEAEVKLRPKAFDLLRYLVENHGRLVGKEELIRSVWADTAVTDNSLAQCLIEIRRGLGDDSQTIIRNVPRRGYIFDAPVTDAAPLPGSERQLENAQTGRPTPEGVSTPDTSEPGIKRRIWLVLAATAIMAILASVAAFKVPGIRQRLFAGSAASGIRSIVVLPLEGLSNEPDLDYFADGMTDAL